MESTWISSLNRTVLPIGCHGFDDRREVGFQVVETLVDLVQALFEGVEAGPEGVRAVGHLVVHIWWLACVQDSVKVLRVPNESDGKRRERACASTPLDRVVLQLADDGLRHAGAFRQLALTPA